MSTAVLVALCGANCIRSTVDSCLQQQQRKRRGQQRSNMPGKKLCGTNYPLSICFIVVNEFCERFSYYGMKAVLTLYFVSYLHWDPDLSTAVYHAFSSLCYFTPILGALIADAWLGKFRTIIYLSIVYVIVTWSSRSEPFPLSLSMIGLILIAFGTGGIKPCVAAFGGDQFDEEHTSERQKFFSVFYMAINAGSLLSTIITPVLRSGVQCFGDDCYALAFGVPAALMVVALVVFIGGSGMYKRNPPQGNILGEVCNCIGSLKVRPRKQHWLDWAEDKYPKRLIQEIKMVMRVLVLYIPLPMFWALFDQQGSRWTLQATRMNLAFGSSFSIEPDQMQMLNALLILLFVPIFDLVIYPVVSCCKITITPLRKWRLGLVFAAFGLWISPTLQWSVNVMKTVGTPAPAQNALLQVLNVAGSDITVKLPDQDLFPCDDPEHAGPSRIHTLNESTANSLIVFSGPSGLRCKLVEDFIEKSGDGKPFVRFLTHCRKRTRLCPEEYIRLFSSALGQTLVTNSWTWGCWDFGASYTFVLSESSGEVTANKMEDVKAITSTWPGRFLIRSVNGRRSHVLHHRTGVLLLTGVSLRIRTKTGSPANMKSVLRPLAPHCGFWNVIVLIVAEEQDLNRTDAHFTCLTPELNLFFVFQWIEFLLFALLLLFVCVIFSIMAAFYTYVDPEELNKVYLTDSKYGSTEEKKRRPSDGFEMDRKGKSTKL
ncbi:hypothetical protein WMY93_028848 [Mugilogobius chulae]|uniref:Solute carrier family 15 member 2 n=1 Tax=Mugilogobius chulae TaxID=88201 RepID=A0AAW0MTN5_9GOBI